MGSESVILENVKDQQVQSYPNTGGTVTSCAACTETSEGLGGLSPHGPRSHTPVPLAHCHLCPHLPITVSVLSVTHDSGMHPGPEKNKSVLKDHITVIKIVVVKTHFQEFWFSRKLGFYHWQQTLSSFCVESSSLCSFLRKFAPDVKVWISAVGPLLFETSGALSTDCSTAAAPGLPLEPFAAPRTQQTRRVRVAHRTTETRKSPTLRRWDGRTMKTLKSPTLRHWDCRTMKTLKSPTLRHWDWEHQLIWQVVKDVPE